MFFRLGKILFPISLVFLIVLLISLSLKGNINREFRVVGGPGISKDSLVQKSKSISQFERKRLKDFETKESKDSKSSVNSVNLIIYMIYKVTNKSLK
jgi:hypothetical protein